MIVVMSCTSNDYVLHFPMIVLINSSASLGSQTASRACAGLWLCPVSGVPCHACALVLQKWCETLNHHLGIHIPVRWGISEATFSWPLSAAPVKAQGLNHHLGVHICIMRYAMHEAKPLSTGTGTIRGGKCSSSTPTPTSTTGEGRPWRHGRVVSGDLGDPVTTQGRSSHRLMVVPRAGAG
jgi:hypothetical protein